jgi:Lrp/AsnC family leucine-responsive transcriptional regulator
MEKEKNTTSLHATAALLLDRLDMQILNLLQQDGRISNLELAQRVHLSPAQCNRRHRRLEEQGLIRRYHAQLDSDKLGYPVTAFIQVQIERGQLRALQDFQDAVRQLPDVMECYAVSGDFDYVCKVVAVDLGALYDFLLHTLAQLPAVSSVKSSICLHELKCSRSLPLAV